MSSIPHAGSATDGIPGVRVAEVPRVGTRAAGRARRTDRFHPRRRWCLPRGVGGKPVLRSGRRDASRRRLSYDQKKDRGILRLRRRVRLHVRLGLLGSRAVGLAIDSASCRTLRPPRPGDSGRSRTRPDDWTACAQVGLGRRRYSSLPRSPFSSRSSISTPRRANHQMREQTLCSKIPRMRPRRVSGAPMAAVRARSGIRNSPKSRPKTSRTSSASGPSTRATFRTSTDRS